jgi:hypothetical protein
MQNPVGTPQPDRLPALSRSDAQDTTEQTIIFQTKGIVSMNDDKNSKDAELTPDVPGKESGTSEVDLPGKPADTRIAKLDDIAINRRAAAVELTQIETAVVGLLNTVQALKAQALTRYWDHVATSFGFNSLGDVRAAGWEMFVDENTLEAKLLSADEAKQLKEAQKKAAEQGGGTKPGRGEPLSVHLGPARVQGTAKLDDN